MARNLHVYPKAVLQSDVWTYILKVYEHSTSTAVRFEHVVAAGIIAETPLRLLKVSFDLQIGDTDLLRDVDDALFVDDIKPGPQIATVWSEWQDRAENIISGLASGYTVADFWAAWTKSDTSQVRTDVRRALITQRGWTVVPGSVHQHEGDDSVTDE